MRRSERRIEDPAEVSEVLEKARTLVLGIADEEAPYLVPLCYGHEADRLYIHSGPGGTKMELLARSPMVSFAAVEEPVIRGGPASCSFSARSRSVVGYGRARVVTDPEERVRGLDAIMRHYAPPPYSYDPGKLEKTVVLAIDIRAMQGKRTG